MTARRRRRSAVRSLILLAGVALLHSASGGDVKLTDLPKVPASRIVQAKYLQRSDPSQSEVVILNGAPNLFVLLLDRQPIATIARRETLLLYLPPGRYRLTMREVRQVLVSAPAEVVVEVKPNTLIGYSLVQSSGFTSSGGNATYDFRPLEIYRPQNARSSRSGVSVPIAPARRD
jgi:hypothetical protein